MTKESKAHNRGQKIPESSILGFGALIISIVALGVSFWQGSIMRQSMRADQRAWVTLAAPATFPLNGTSIPVVTQISNTGKTPALDVEGDYVATVLKRGDAPTIGDFSVGHPHNRLHAGAVFPNSPIPMTLPVVRYGAMAGEPVVPDEALRQDIPAGNQFIIFYGRITYRDVFGARHWTQFCTGSGDAIGKELRDCIAYNSVGDE